MLSVKGTILFLFASTNFCTRNLNMKVFLFKVFFGVPLIMDSGFLDLSSSFFYQVHILPEISWLFLKLFYYYKTGGFTIIVYPGLP